ncbi:MAG: nitrous oxide reductase accessory protein NosL [Bacteroidetes bacterium]|nr:nitrous oxide reductase accessory protein NosL [Bacteroidota bacterium]
MTTRLNIVSKSFLLITAVLLAVSIFTPIWRIELDAPQYPEGLFLQIFSNKLGGNVEIINGLNHYIGMKTLHEDDFIEFTVLPYIIGFFALASVVVMLAGKKRGLYLLFAGFVFFGIIAMIDFWRWEYDYGHDLNPNAAIIVPGMAYQPPLIGFKQLLNFGAYSIPDIGGWLFIASGLLMLAAVIIEIKKSKTEMLNKKIVIQSTFALILLASCGPIDKEPIKINKEKCDNCKMMISDPRFAGELVTEKGRVYKFDDVTCLKSFMQSQKHEYHSILISDYLPPHELHAVNTMHFITGANINSPMRGNVAAFSDKQNAATYSTQLSATFTTWESILK